MTDSSFSAYREGVEAALRIGKYDGYKRVPDNPYPEGTPEAEEWDDGFGDATEDLVHGV